MTEPLTVICTECGVVLEIKDVQAIILALHLQNECEVSGLFSHSHREG